MCRSHPIFCILPPHLLSAVSHRGSAQQRAWALRTMSVDNTFRALRASQAAPLDRRAATPAPPGRGRREAAHDLHRSQ